MHLIIGLGNPGERYRRTRHNVGFMVVDALSNRAEARTGKPLAQAWVAEGSLGGEEVVLAKPLAFMNRSGPVVAELLNAYEVRLDSLLVVLDDVALPLGTIRVRERGGHGGHNGMRSLIEALGSEEFARIRLGIQRDEADAELADYVLSPFPPEDVLVVQEAVGRAADATECFLREGPQAAMTQFNRTDPTQ